MLNKCRNCGSEAEFFVPKSGGNGATCRGCGNQLYHQDYTRQQIERVWNWRNSDKYEED